MEKNALMPDSLLSFFFFLSSSIPLGKFKTTTDQIYQELQLGGDVVPFFFCFVFPPFFFFSFFHILSRKRASISEIPGRIRRVDSNLPMACLVPFFPPFFPLFFPFRGPNKFISRWSSTEKVYVRPSVAVFFCIFFFLLVRRMIRVKEMESSVAAVSFPPFFFFFFLVAATK